MNFCNYKLRAERMLLNGFSDLLHGLFSFFFFFLSCIVVMVIISCALTCYLFDHFISWFIYYFCIPVFLFNYIIATFYLNSKVSKKLQKRIESNLYNHLPVHYCFFQTKTFAKYFGDIGVIFDSNLDNVFSPHLDLPSNLFNKMSLSFFPVIS